MAALKAFSVKLDIWILSQALSDIFLDVWIILSCLSVCLIILCWKLYLLDNNCSNSGHCHPLSSICGTCYYCWYIYDWLDDFNGKPLMFFLKRCSLGYSHRFSVDSSLPDHNKLVSSKIDSQFAYFFNNTLWYKLFLTLKQSNFTSFMG